MFSHVNGSEGMKGRTNEKNCKRYFEGKIKQKIRIFNKQFFQVITILRQIQFQTSQHGKSF